MPQTGLFYPDYSEDTTIKYREIPEYGVWVLEFISGGLGLINKAVPHVVFKRFAQSCWSELCEIFGIPPRVLKTNTQDDEMLDRAEEMMRDMGSAAWFIIDDSEEFEFAKGVNTNGDVYKNLIVQCSNEISLLISGAVIGQDTQNGSRSKDESGQEMLWQLVLSDMALLEDFWTATIIPSLIKMGFIKPGKYRFEFDEVEDLDALWEMVIAAWEHMDIDVEWVVEKFGIKGTKKKEAATTEKEKEPAKLAASFFD